jgi:hypothetical protein
MSPPNAFFAQPCFREASPDFEKLKAATKLSLKTSGIRLALAIDCYRVEAFLTEAHRDLACGPTSHEDVRYFPISRKELIGAGHEIDRVACGHTLDHPGFEPIFAPIFDAAVCYLVGEMIKKTHAKNGLVATIVLPIARARYTINVFAANDWFNVFVEGLCLFEQIDRNLLERTGRYLEERLILHLSPSLLNAKTN